MTTKNINMDWASQYLKADENTDSSRHVDWVGKKQFKKMLKFKVLPANAQENDKIGGAVVSAKHWNLGVNQDQSFLCVEKMFPEKGVVCPVCQLKRDLIKMGIDPESLKRPGKFGPIDIFEPQVQSCVKVVVIDSDTLKDQWDKAHVSVLQMNSNYLVKWLVETYLDQDTPDFLNFENGNLIKFSRDQDNSKWERQVLDSSIKWDVSPEVMEKVRKENEELVLSDLWKFPSDDEFLRIKGICEDMKNQILTSVNTIKEAQKQVEEAVNNVNSYVAPQQPVVDSIPDFPTTQYSGNNMYTSAPQQNDVLVGSAYAPGSHVSPF